MPAWEAPPAKEKRLPVVPIAIAAVLVFAIASGFLYMRSRSSSAAPVQPAASRPAVTPKPVGTQTNGSAVTNATMTTTTPPVVAATQAPVLDTDLVNQEVQKRLAAERARLEQQNRAGQKTPPLTASTAAPALVNRVTPPPVQPQPVPQQATQTVAPQPIVQTATAAPPTATQQAVATQTTAPEPVTETVARVREGDLVPSGTEGLVPARVLRRGAVPYPPMARAQRVEGTIICSVLVSETGQVLDVRVLRGTERGGLNEAAQQIMRRSTFSPPTKDGVRVKAWTTVPVDFKL